MKIIGNDPKAQDAEVRAVASGALTDGSTVVVNSDGTVSVVGETSVPQSVGSPTVFESANASLKSSTYDANAQRVVISYRDRGNSDYGTAVVGTVSGTSISFGTPVVFESANISYNSVVYDANAQKVVIAYRDESNSNYGTAVVGTVSGTSISFGSPVVFESANTQYNSATYDSNNQKVVIAYRDVGNSSYGTAIVGTVSGTSISFGTPVVFESGTTTYPSATYDANAQKVVIAYEDQSNSNYGTAIVGTVSGTSISFGTPVVFEGSTSEYITSTYDADALVVVIAYADVGNSNYGTAVVFQNSYSFTNLTTENFIGVSKGAYTDTEVATIQTGCSINDAQTGLTAGQTYYVQADGTLGTSPDTPSVEAGTALSSTKLLIKG